MAYYVKSVLSVDALVIFNFLGGLIAKIIKCPNLILKILPVTLFKVIVEAFRKSAINCKLDPEPCCDSEICSGSRP